MSSTLFHRLCLGAILLAYFVSAGAVQAQNTTPLSAADILKLIDLEIEDEVIVARIAKVGVSFAADDAAVERLKKGKASDVVLAAVKKAASARAGTQEKSTTYDDVMQLLKLGIAEDRILARLKKSPTKFILGADQVVALKKAGASDSLLAAMKSGPREVAVGKLTDLAIILDCSGSMEEKTKEGTTKMEAARRAAADMIKKLPGHLRLAFVIYGHDASLKCEAIKVVHSLGKLDDSARADLLKVIAGLRPAGHTPIAGALKLAGAELANKPDAACGIILITDGIETCKGDPAAEASKLTKKLNLTFGVNVVGFGLDKKETESVKAIAESGKGKYYPAENAGDLNRTMAALTAEVAKEVEKPVADTVEEGKAAKRAFKVATPTLKGFPKMKEIRVYKTGSTGLAGAEVTSENYDEEIRLPSGDKYDIFWVPTEGNAVLLKGGFSIAEPTKSITVFKPEGYLGLVHVSAGGLPKATKIVLERDYGRAVVSAFQQTATKYGSYLVAPPGNYKLFIVRADNDKQQKVEDKVVVTAGKVTEVE